jgi:phosphopantothenoylcysteine decarboxylase/phosphopantothenate--cysteine ligase
MGYALAKAAGDYGAKVILISGPVSLPEPANIKIIRVETTSGMLRAVLKNIKKADIFIMAAAPGDFTVDKKVKGKIKRAGGSISLKLKPTPDILKIASRTKNLKKNLIKIGFAAETHSLIPGAYKKLKDKKLDIIIANDISRKDIGFESDYNRVFIIKKDKTVIKTEKLKKEKLAGKIILYALDKSI